MARKSEPDKKPDRRPAKSTDLIPKDYEQFLGELKDRIRTAQLRAAISVNRELVLLYWQIGRDILARQKQHGWGAKVIDRLAARPPARVSRNGRILPAKPQVHEGLCPSLA